MSPETDPYAGWQRLPETTTRSRAKTIFLLVAAGVAGVLGLLYGVAYLNDSEGRDPLLLLLRAASALFGVALLGAARVTVRKESGRIKGVLSVATTVFAAGLLDALFLFFDEALGLPDLTRLLVFLFMGILATVLVLLLLRKESSDENSVPAFFAKNAPIVAFLLFLIVTRIALKDLLQGLLPSLFLNLIFLVTFLSAAIYLIARFLGKFGSPVSWGDAKRHEQVVERMNDVRMEDVRELLRQYVKTGRKLAEYQDLMRAAMTRIQAAPEEFEPLLKKPPSALRPALPSTPPGILLVSTFAIALAAGAFTVGLFALASTRPSIYLVGLVVAAIVQPIVSAVVRANDPVPAPAAQYGLAGLLAAGPAAVLYVIEPAAVLPIGAGLVVGLVYLGLGAVRLLRRRTASWPPDQAFLRVESTQEQARRAKSFLYAGPALALLAPLWMIVSWAAKRWIDLGQPPGPILVAGFVGGALIAGAGYLLGPGLNAHRETVRTIHNQETGLRQSYHRVLVKKLEGART